jgi:hypothetical protein
MDKDDEFAGIPDYEKLLQLEDYESLLEELEEGGWESDLQSAGLPGEMLGRINAARISSTGELRDKIARLHASIDDD